MTTTNEPKYKIVNGKIVNRASGEAIPDDEPIFILRARDKHALATLEAYHLQVRGPAKPGQALAPLAAIWPEGNAMIPTGSSHEAAVAIRRAQFARFAKQNPDRMKEPDTTLTEDWVSVC